MPTQRTQIAAANWKMNLSPAEGLELMQQLVNSDCPDNVEIIIAAPFIMLPLLAARHGGEHIQLAAQNMHQADSGAYTGEISASMLSSIDVQAVILGHSERREYFGESDELISQKLTKAFKNKLNPIYCCGEKLKTRQENKHESLVEDQIRAALSGLSNEQAEKLIIAYEPVWAIGTGETASPQQAQDMHAHIRSVLKDLFGNSTANHIPILYGGSVKPNNAKELFSMNDVDGGLVGGASLKADDFLSIIRSF